MTKMMMKFGISQGAIPPSLQSAVSTVNTNQSSAGNMMQLPTKSADQVSQGLSGSLPVQIGSDFENTPLRGNAVDSAFGSRTEKVISNFLQNPILKGEGGGLDEAVCTHFHKWQLDAMPFHLFITAHFNHLIFKITSNLDFSLTYYAFTVHTSG